MSNASNNQVAQALYETDPAQKCRLTALIIPPVQPSKSHTPPNTNREELSLKSDPGRPAKPELVPPAAVPRRRLGSIKGRAALMHAVAHIEFNAINLALDMLLRFGNDPIFETTQERNSFFKDWLSVAKDEARHFTMVCEYLGLHGFRYGDFPAHNGLWDAAKETCHDIAARLAIAPMVLEARGLDVTPQMIERFRKIDDQEAVGVLEVILEEEVAHVGFGTQWFNFVALKRNKSPEDYYQWQVRNHFRGILKQPFNKKARNEAGLYEDYYLPLSAS